ncbi:undecaprenyldiphospho-muramoylpentapeptide beta-N-acetylglucosaminyltransferase [Schleiferilactobacillus perolens]|uniref:undecaprenyldiphospho-muramoylpentapeptide beta-N-acetylglucosaminyltransferase n=1 Tax=Schleiferilactobacillus perolens TaxID=100468 RepID=UPI0023572486|nr:undecaprenyldiphospho-muramoylpentapeptide beta-N-acetylglucosaminyltransferase [Schleiferilactobacillus perolens]MCI2171300.1 undecaprenyldiphospho-muramoylpentapeptide beta-N-acetylglucosaminyltransferase [Schleiferilactobacillus perolens]
MRLMISGGGTGGHIYPALALIRRLQERKLLDAIQYVGTPNGLESRIVPAADIPFSTIELQGFNRRNLFANFRTVDLFLKAVHKAKAMVREFQPDIVIGTGGYVSSALVYAAAREHIPTMIHEQNSIAGVTNKFLAHYVDKILIAFPDAADQFRQKDKIVLVGNPRAQEVAGLQPNARLADFQLSPNRSTVLIFGGSRGAAPINEAVLSALAEFGSQSYQVLFVTGNVHYQNVLDQLGDKAVPNNVKIVPYVDDMPAILPDVTLLVGRAGATSIAEITALGIPSILIPSPYVTHNHQTKNASSMAQAGAAVMLPETALTDKTLLNAITAIMGDDDRQAKMKKATLALGHPHASDDIIQLMQDLIQA